MICVRKPPLATIHAREGLFEGVRASGAGSGLAEAEKDAQLRRHCAFLRTEPSERCRQGLILSV